MLLTTLLMKIQDRLCQKVIKHIWISPTGLQYLVDRATEIVSPTNVDDRIIGTVSGSESYRTNIR